MAQIVQSNQSWGAKILESTVCCLDLDQLPATQITASITGYHLPLNDQESAHLSSFNTKTLGLENAIDIKQMKGASTTNKL